ncbi:MAG: GNAT family N-acetyltransferase [Gammaproteobacteria bacterium]
MKHIRRLSASDRSPVLRINADSVPGVARLDHTEFDRLLELPNAHQVIEDTDGTIIGYLLAFPSKAPYDGEEFIALVLSREERFLYIDQVAVASGMRRTGAASALYDRVENHARQSAFASLCCEVNLVPPNPGSLAFHRNAGFVRLNSMETADGRTVVLLRKALGPTAAGAR